MAYTNRADARRTIVRVLAADAGCDAEAFAGDGVTVLEHRDLMGRRRFRLPERPLVMLSMGGGLVISCHRDWLDLMQGHAASMDRLQLLEPASVAWIQATLAEGGSTLLGPHLSHACADGDLREHASIPGVALQVLEGDALEPVRSVGTFPNALPSRNDPARPDMLAVAAESGGTIVACAAASADAERLWQIGVDVLPAYRHRGIGRAVVGRLVAAVLAAGSVPYYTHSISNVASAALASSVGFWPAWVQWYAREVS